LPGIILLEYLKEGEAERIIQSFIKLNKGKLLTSKFIEDIKMKLPGDWGPLKREYDSKDGIDYPKRMIGEIRSRKAALNDVLKGHGLNDFKTFIRPCFNNYIYFHFRSSIFTDG